MVHTGVFWVGCTESACKEAHDPINAPSVPSTNLNKPSEGASHPNKGRLTNTRATSCCATICATKVRGVHELTKLHRSRPHRTCSKSGLPHSKSELTPSSHHNNTPATAPPPHHRPSSPSQINQSFSQPLQSPTHHHNITTPQLQTWQQPPSKSPTPTSTSTSPPPPSSS